MKIVNADPDTLAGDFHSQNMEKIFGIPYEEQAKHQGLRVQAKNHGFGAFYGSMGEEVQEVIEKKILASPELGDPPTLAKTKAGIREVRRTYPHYFNEWWPFMVRKVRQEYDCVAYTAFGRPRYVPDLRSRDPYLRAAAERQVINHIAGQGTAGDLMRMGMLRVSKIQGGKLLLNIHDELVSMVDEEHLVRYTSEMKEAMLLGQPLEGVPLVVNTKFGKNWKEAHP
jgi:DNA polymerase-1